MDLGLLEIRPGSKEGLLFYTSVAYLVNYKIFLYVVFRILKNKLLLGTLI